MARRVRFCPRCGANQPFVGPVRLWRALLDVVLSAELEDDTGIGWRKLRCEACGLPARKASRTAFPT